MPDAKKTDLEQLQDAQTEIAELKTNLVSANQKALSLGTKVTELETEKSAVAAQLATASENLSTAHGEKAAVTAQLATANEQITKLTGEAKTAEQRAREIAASKGAESVPKPADAATKDGHKADNSNLVGFDKVRASIREELTREK